MMQIKTWQTILATLLLWVALPAFAQVPAQGEILKIEVRLAGAPTGVDEDFVRAHIRLKVGDTYRPGLENEDVKTLVGTGRISNVIVYVRPAGGGVQIIYTIQRARSTGTVLLLGFDGQREISADRLKIKSSKLFREMSLRQDEPYSARKVAADVRALVDYYNSKGYHDAKVDSRPKLDVATQKQNVTFIITEGEKVKIEEIRFRAARAVNTIALGTDLLTTELEHDLVTGDPVRLFVQAAGSGRADASVPMPTALAAQPGPDGQRAPERLLRVARYFVRVTARNQFTLHYTAAAARSGSGRVDFTEVADVLHYLETPMVPRQWTVKKLTKAIETRERRRWWNPVSWFTGDGRIMESKMEMDINQLRKNYRAKGYLDVVVDIDKSPDIDYAPGTEYDLTHRAWRQAEFRMGFFKSNLDQVEPGGSIEIDGTAYNEADLKAGLEKAEDSESATYKKYKAARKSVRLATMTYRVVEGRQYHVGKVEFQFGNTNLKGAFEPNPELKPVLTAEALTSVLTLTEGEVFQPDLLRSENDSSDLEAIRNAYGRKSYNKSSVLAVTQADPNTARIDITYRVEEGKPVFIELIKIEGNVETKDFVIRRELAVSPGEPFDMGRVKLSKERIEGLRLFEQVRTEQEPIAGFEDRENLVISLKERRTARAGFGGGFSTDYGAFGQVFYAEENFDILRWRQPHPLQGGGQKFRVRAALGARRDNYTLDFEEPWMFGRKLRFTSSLYASEYEYFSDYYDVSQAGLRLGLERTLLGLDYLRGRVNYTIESTGIYNVSDSASAEMKGDGGRDLISKVGLTLAYDTRDGGYLPTKGQRTEFTVETASEMVGSDKDFYKLNLTTAQYFKGFKENHVIEAIVRTGVVDNYGDTTEVPFIERYSLGGTSTLRGFEFREVGPRDAKNQVIGGKTMAVGTLEYSVPLPLGDWVRFATFYDIGFVSRSAYDFSFDDYNDDWGIGLRMNIPFLGPMRLDYAFPLNTDAYNDKGGNFNFTFGYTQAF